MSDFLTWDTANRKTSVKQVVIIMLLRTIEFIIRSSPFRFLFYKGKGEPPFLYRKLVLTVAAMFWLRR